MRNLPLLLALLLLSVLLSAVSAQASLLPAPQLPPTPLLAEEEEEDEGEELEEDEESEDCVIEDEEDVQLCAEIAKEEKEAAEAERCVLESASASVDANPSNGKIRFTIRYTTYGSAPFSLRYSLRGGKGTLQLGSTKARFSQAGAFHDIVRIDERKLPKMLAAREFQIELQAQKAPDSCRERLTVQHRGAGRAHRS
jgi:hypothetical protein